MGPLIKTHMNRCIHCTRCVRFSEEEENSEKSSHQKVYQPHLYGPDLTLDLRCTSSLMARVAHPDQVIVTAQDQCGQCAIPVQYIKGIQVFCNAVFMQFLLESDYFNFLWLLKYERIKLCD